MAVTNESRLRASALLCTEDDLNEMEYIRTRTMSMPSVVYGWKWLSEYHDARVVMSAKVYDQ